MTGGIKHILFDPMNNYLIMKTPKTCFDFHQEPYYVTVNWMDILDMNGLSFTIISFNYLKVLWSYLLGASRTFPKLTLNLFNKTAEIIQDILALFSHKTFHVCLHALQSIRH